MRNNISINSVSLPPPHPVNLVIVVCDVENFHFIPCIWFQHYGLQLLW